MRQRMKQTGIRKETEKEINQEMNGQVNTLDTKKNTYNNIIKHNKNRHLQKKKDLQRGKKCNLKRTTFLFEVLCYQYRQRIDPAQSAEP